VRALPITASEADRALLLRSLRSGSDLLRASGAKALALLGGGGVGAALRPLLSDKNSRVRLAAAEFLSGQGDRASLSALVDLLGADDFSVRWRAVYLLKQTTGQRFGYSANDEPEVRALAIAQWRRWVEENGQAAELRAAAPGEQQAGVPIFNGEDLKGWTEMGAAHVGNANAAAPPQRNRVEGFSVEDGLLVCNGLGKSELVHDDAMENFVLRVECRGTPGLFSNGGLGILVPAGGDGLTPFVEIDLQPETAGDIIAVGGVIPGKNRQGAPLQHRARAERPANANAKAKADAGAADEEAWTEVEIQLDRGSLTVSIGGTEVNRASELPAGPHRILLRNEGTWFEFRSITLSPLP
jgi:hypothetical protein